MNIPSNNPSSFKRKGSSRPMTADPLQPSRRVAIVRKRRCLRSANPLPRQARADAKYCSTSCQITHWHRRRRTTRALTRKPKCAGCGKRLAITCRADARYCSVHCRQRAHRRRKVGRQVLPAHQRLIRDQLATVATPRPVADIGTATVREISRAEAKAIILRYEWLGSMPAVSRYCFGIFFDGELGGVVVYGNEYAENLGVWDRYGYSGRIITLQRGACVHWAHPHAASKLIRRSMDLLPARFEVVTASVDAFAGEVGTIYQAAGFDFVGTMRPGRRALVRINGKTLSERTVGQLAGTQGVRALGKLGFDVISVPRRARYFAFRGSRRERKRNRAAIAHLIQTYPKRFQQVA